MKKLKTLFAAALCLCAVCALCAAPAHALECVATSSVSLTSACGESSLTPLWLLSPQSLEGGFAGTPISAPGNPEYGKPTSIEPAVTTDGGAMKNEDVSKNAALIPPGFGSAGAYTPNTGVPLTPNLAPGYMLGEGATVTGSDGITIIPPDLSGILSSGTAVYPGASASTVGYTEVTSGLYYSDGSLGTLKIPAIGVTVKVYQGTDTDALAKGAGHFENTSIWDGNVAIAGHNRGVHNVFGKLHTLKTGDVITLTTRLGTRTYAVTGVTRVSVYDISGLSPSGTNTVTLYTCVMDQPDYRWCVTAVAVDG